LAIATQPDPIY